MFINMFISCLCIRMANRDLKPFFDSTLMFFGVLGNREKCNTSYLLVEEFEEKSS